MSEHDLAEDSVSLPGPGRYPVPDHHGKLVVERGWDGEVWTDEVGAAPEGATLPGYKKHVFRFLRNGGWKVFLAMLITIGGAAAFWADDRKADVVHGIQILGVPLAAIATFLTMVAFLRFIGARVGFDRISPDTRKEILKWGIASGVIAFALAYAVEVFVPKVFGDSIKDDPGWAALAGPAEETGKLLVPVILWIKLRFRIPREGYLLVLISAATVGVMEGTEYAIQPKEYQPIRPLFEIMHPLLTGFVAAVAWQAAWRGKSIFTGVAIGAWILAMAAHSTNDVIVLSHHVDGSVARVTSLVSIAVILLMYLLQKHSARQLVPPDKVGEVSPRWRPAAPKRPAQA
ncbi:MAG: PrsW family intramembrane metalloprotease [Solirubrobacterales bacterium]|nr:PrsW family intramembrane metalloprotease [Solirubrobacterales bacterium]OJU93761.1 MAG: hypothetical protein BGO23_14170 [Solirubrobacterales bacterium 67-14]